MGLEILEREERKKERKGFYLLVGLYRERDK
jgi:hypothetical protein